MKEIAKITNRRVIGWDDWYAVVPHGRQYEALPNGAINEIGNTGREYEGSTLEALAEMRKEYSGRYHLQAVKPSDVSSPKSGNKGKEK